MGNTDDGAHLFGDVYWRTTNATAVLALLFLATSVVPFGTWVRTFDSQARWLLVHYPDATIWLTRNWAALPMVFLGAAIAVSIQLDSGE